MGFSDFLRQQKHAASEEKMWFKNILSKKSKIFLKISEIVYIL